MGRIVLAVWLALFAVQTSELLAAVAPDDCVEDSGSAADPCPDRCARCVCCARVAPLVPTVVSDVTSALPVRIPVPPSITAATSTEPRGILHVPKTH